jgi:uncharacterized protein YndB with AHSA1/START domain
MNARADQIERSTEIDAPVSRVWRALTNHEEFGEWFQVRLDGPFVAGQVSTGYMTFPGYEHLRWEAAVQRIEPESLFAFTWHPYAVDPTVNYSGETATLVTFCLEPAGSGCRLTVTETGFDQIPFHRRAEALSSNVRGWAVQLENIKRHVGENP